VLSAQQPSVATISINRADCEKLVMSERRKLLMSERLEITLDLCLCRSGSGHLAQVEWCHWGEILRNTSKMHWHLPFSSIHPLNKQHSIFLRSEYQSTHCQKIHRINTVEREKQFGQVSPTVTQQRLYLYNLVNIRDSVKVD
jgi:hypothetical protein